MTPDEHQTRLVALRDRLAAAIAVAQPNMLPQLAGQYRATLDDLAKLGAAKPRVGIQDDLKKRRAERRKQQRSTAKSG